MKWKAPKEHKYGKGWLLGKTKDGRNWFSDGHAMFVGKRQGCKLPNPDSIEFVLNACVGKKISPAKVTDRSIYDSILTVVLNKRVRVQVLYYRYAKKHFPRVKFFLGAKFDNSRAVICKVGPSIVGVIAPMRNPEW